MKDLNYNSNILKKVASLDTNLDKTEQIQLIEQIIDSGKLGQELLLNILIDRCIVQKRKVKFLDGLIFEFLYFNSSDCIKTKLKSYFSCGLIELNSYLRLNYQPLQDLLILHSFQEADKLTQHYLCLLAKLDHAPNRNWLYFTDVFSFPSEDLYILDQLWRIYSRNKFGFSVQRKIWLSVNKDWKKFWSSIGWSKNGVLSRYPSEFLWNINAPYGHLPLFNQLRGVQVISALFNHRVWNQDDVL
uniref:hypothetical protein n=1 Tax=Gracilaria urvillei TaxID=172974 RepID=UPI001D1157BD|nr:hypothetical protein LK147_pgp183 [Hydropuntia urvillei]UAD88357.1 hypothetical protein [Hydropuntia urvillei]